MSEKKLFLYRLLLSAKYQNPTAWDESTSQTIQAHVKFLDGLGQQGDLVFAGRTQFDPGDDRLLGIALIKAESLQQAQRMMADDPTVVQGIHEAAIWPFALAVEYLDNLINGH